MSKIDINNVVRVTVQSAAKGLVFKNTSALAILTHEEPIITNYGAYRNYLDSSSVAKDWGSSATVTKMAEVIFAQKINIKTGKGFLTIIPRVKNAPASAATLMSNKVNLLSLNQDDLKIKLSVDGDTAVTVSIGAIDFTDIDSVLTSLNPTSLSDAGAEITISGDLTNCFLILKSLTTGVTSELSISTPVDGTDLLSLVGISGDTFGKAAGVEGVKDCIYRTYSSIDYFGILLTQKQSYNDQLEISNLIQSVDKIMFIASDTFTDVNGVDIGQGLFKTIMNSSLTQTRCLFHNLSANNSLLFASAYASRALSTNFDAGNSVSTMNLKDLVGIPVDVDLTQTQLDACKQNGVDVYADIGAPVLLTSGQNKYFDTVYISLAFKFKVQIALFNTLKGTQGVIPQTEAGMNLLKKAQRIVCDQFVFNGAFAPGTWNGVDTFGNPEDFSRNISDFGYYIYSLPIYLQDQTTRESRIAPVCQIACKSSGAIHELDIMINLEA